MARAPRRLLIGLALAALAATGCMSVPAGLHVYESSTGCTSNGVCPWADGTAHDFYDAPTREIVVAPDQPLKVWAHEACHAHQHQTVLDELGIEPGVDLQEWYLTREAADYLIYYSLPTPWNRERYSYSELEDFAEACGRYLTQPVDDGRFPSDPYRDAFFEERGFR